MICTNDLSVARGRVSARSGKYCSERFVLTSNEVHIVGNKVDLVHGLKTRMPPSLRKYNHASASLRR